MNPDLHETDKAIHEVPISSPTIAKDEEDCADVAINPEKCDHLTVQEIWNLLFCFLAWACNVSTVTLGK